MQFIEQVRGRSSREVIVMAALFAGLLGLVYLILPDADDDVATNFCPQRQALTVPGEFTPSEHFYSPEYAKFSLKAFQGALRVPTVSYDDMSMDPTADPRYDVFKKLHAHLEHTFPLASRRVEKVNELGLLYTIPGSDRNLKPVVLMSHQDVVPVAESSLDEWDYPPFEAHFDGEWVYGRGSADTKNTVVAILEAVEALLAQGYLPKRTLLVSFGFDEEISGYRGALELSKVIEQRYGADGVELIVDEGFGAPVVGNLRVASVTVAEKGYMDIKATLNTPGGHSSIPPDHTGIGILSQLVKLLESRPFTADLDDVNPTLATWRCVAEHAPSLNKELRRTILDIDAPRHREKFVDFLSHIPEQKYLIKTSQAVDLIEGGVKVNALPEQASVTVNHRINVNSGTHSVYERFEEIVAEVAERFGLGIVSQGETVLEPTEKGYFNISSSKFLEPSPISPYTGAQWDLIAGTSQSIFSSGPYKVNESLIVAPSLFPANTDTRHYWSLTRAIYRFTPALGEDVLAYHTVNERLRLRSHLIAVAWFYELILNSTF